MGLSIGGPPSQGFSYHFPYKSFLQHPFVPRHWTIDPIIQQKNSHGDPFGSDGASWDGWIRTLEPPKMKCTKHRMGWFSIWNSPKTENFDGYLKEVWMRNFLVTKFLNMRENRCVENRCIERIDAKRKWMPREGRCVENRCQERINA